jgi:isopenicillin-N N-acyltransferase-like protein
MTRHLEIGGTPREIGLAHGQQLAAEIAATIAIYRDAFDLPEDRIISEAARFAERIAAYAPALGEEINAIAQGAGQPAHWIYALNARSELMAASVGECTAIFFPDTGVIGQTWDWMEQLEPLFAVLTIRSDEGHALITVTEPGIVGKIGLSGAGIGVCLNFMGAATRQTGVPIHIVLREMMEARNLAEARGRMDEAGAGRSGHILVGSAADGGFSREFVGDLASTTDIANRPFAHTNHCLQLAAEEEEVRVNSEARLATAVALVGRAGKADLRTVQHILSDESHPTHRICRPYRPQSGMTIGTVCTVAMDLRERRLDVRSGPEAGAPFDTYPL